MIAGCLKLFLRELPEPLIPYRLHSELVQAALGLQGDIAESMDVRKKCESIGFRLIQFCSDIAGPTGCGGEGYAGGRGETPREGGQSQQQDGRGQSGTLVRAGLALARSTSTTRHETNCRFGDDFKNRLKCSKV